MQLRYMGSDRLHPEDDVVRLPRSDSDESPCLLRLYAERPAACGQWELADYDLLAALFRLVWRQADRDNLRLSEDDGRNRDLVELALVPGDDLCDHLTLGAGLVCEPATSPMA